MNEELDIQRSELIHAYVLGTMGEAERVAFELELAADAALRKEVEAVHDLHMAIQREPELRFRQLVQRVSAEQQEGGGGLEADTPVIPVGRRTNLRWLAVAASVTVVLAVGVTQWLTAPDTQELAIAYAQRSLPSTRSDTDLEPYSGIAELDNALTYILRKEPDNALALLASYSPDVSALVCKRDWLSALALLQMDRDTEATAYLDKVLEARCYPEESYAKELKLEL